MDTFDTTLCKTTFQAFKKINVKENSCQDRKRKGQKKKKKVAFDVNDYFPYQYVPFQCNHMEFVNQLTLGESNHLKYENKHNTKMKNQLPQFNTL